jgi:lambda repressor-like predicted transcriptional regulator
MKPRYKLQLDGRVVGLPIHPADIKHALAKAGVSQVDIAKALRRGASGHVHKSAVSRVIAGSLISASIASGIAKACGLPVAQLWPGKYPDLEKTTRAHRNVNKSTKRGATA